MPNYNLWQSEVRVRITGAVVIAVIATIVIAVFVNYPARRPEIQFAAFVFGASAAIYSAYHAGLNVRINLYRDRQKRSYEILDSFNRVDSVTVRITVDEAMDKAETPSLVYKTIRSDPQKDAGVRHLLGVFEDLAIAVRSGYADEGVLYWSLNQLAVRYFDVFKPYIDEVRRDRRNQTLFIEFERLAAAWRTSRSLVTRRSMTNDDGT